MADPRRSTQGDGDFDPVDVVIDILGETPTSVAMTQRSAPRPRQDETERFVPARYDDEVAGVQSLSCSSSETYP